MEARSYSYTSLRIKNRRKNIQILVSVSLAIFVLIGTILFIIYVPKSFNNAQESYYVDSCIGKEGVYKTLAVAADAEICSTTGKNIFKEGGSTIDAGIATLLCVGIANPHSMGLGGGFFGLYYDRPSKKFTSVDGREVAPLKATQNMFVGRQIAGRFGPLAIGVPGEILGYWDLHQKYGKLPWKRLFQPSIKLCKDGFPMAKGLYNAAKYLESANRLKRAGIREWLINPKTDSLYKIGELVKRPMYVETLQKVADGGAHEFYNGSLADLIIKDLKDAGSIIEKDDLKRYNTRLRTPTELTFENGDRLYSLPPPASGPVVGFLLKLVDGFRFKPSDLSKEKIENIVLAYHRIIESMKFAYAARAELGDEDFVDIKKTMKNLTSSDYTDYTRSMITDNSTHDPSYYGHFSVIPTPFGTAHLSLIGPDGSAFSATSTINYYFGSQVVGKRTNIIFNNEMDDFSTPNTTNGFGIPASSNNFIQPGKRPMSSMCPIIIVNDKGDVVDISGASGGSKIATATAWVLSRIKWFGESVKDATDYYRLHHQWLPNHIKFESGFPQECLDGLATKGHVLKKVTRRMAVVQSIHVDKDGIQAYSDARKGGCPDGY